MNIKSAELLQNSLQNAAENILRNRELAQTAQLESQRTAVENAFRQAQLAHYNQIEDRQQDYSDRMQQEGENRALLETQNIQRQQQQSGIAEKQNFLRTAMQLNATGQLAPDGLKRVNDWLSTDPDMGKTGIQLSAPANPSTDPAHAQTALANALSLRQLYQYKFDRETNPYVRSQYSKVLGDIDASLSGKRIGTANPQRPYTSRQQSEPRASASGQVPPAAKSGPNDEDDSSMPSTTPSTQIVSPMAPPPTSAAKATDPRDVQWLTNNPTPSNIAQFEKVYGQGSSDSFFSPKMPSQQ